MGKGIKEVGARRGTQLSDRFAKKALNLVLSALIMMMLLPGCTMDAPVEQPSSAMTEYDNIEAVDNYYRQSSEYVNELTEAWKKKDKKSFEKARKSLIEVCDAFIAVKDLPAEVEDLHEHMVTIASLEEDYARSLSIDDYEAANEALDDIDKEVKKAKESMPDLK